MRPVIRAAVTAGSILLVGALALTARTLTAYGVFTDLTPGFAGTCSAVPTASGPEDIAIDETLGVAFLSAFDRRAQARSGKPSASDGLYVLPLKGEATPRRLAGTPSDFHPHGISLARTPDGKLTLMAINHRADGSQSVDIFTVTGQGSALRLEETGSIQSGELISPNAVLALDASRFYVTNDHGSRTHLGRQLDDLLVLPRANILYFDGNMFHVVANRLAYPSGLAIAPDGRFVYATQAYARRLTAFTRNEISGGLEEAGALDIPSNLDNLRFDALGNLWVGSHPKAFAMATFRADPSKPAPSQIFQVKLLQGLPVSATPIFTDLGGKIGGASVAAVSGKTMLIGSPLDSHILNCRMDH